MSTEKNSKTLQTQVFLHKVLNGLHVLVVLQTVLASCNLFIHKMYSENEFKKK